MFPHGHGIAVLVTIITVVLCVMVHYEGLRILTDKVPMPRHHNRKAVVGLILCLLVMHVIQIWIFGVAYYVLLAWLGIGELQGMETVNLFDCIYFSAMSYTTIGFGDIVPLGSLRLLTGTEGLTGLVMITWSASYTFLVMQRTWNLHD